MEILIGILILLIVVGFSVMLVKQLARIVVVGTVILIGLVVFLHFKGIALNDVYGYVKLTEMVKEMNSKMSYDRENRVFSIKGDEYSFNLKRLDDGIEIRGSASVQNKEAIQSMLNLFVGAEKIFKLDDLLKNPSGVETIGNSAFENVEDMIKNPNQYMNMIKELDKSGNVLQIGKVKMYVKDNQFYVEKEK